MIMRANKEKPSSSRMEKKKSKSSFVYKKTDPKKIHERANQSGGQYDGILKSGVDTFRSKEGDNSVRVLPATWDGHDHYGYDVWAHERVGVDKGSYPCLQKMKQKRCPICEAAQECAEAGEDEDAKSLQPKRKVVCYVVDRSDDNLNPLVWVMGWTMDRDITALCENKKTGKVLYIDHPDEGYDVSFKRKGTGLNTRYIGLSIDRDASSISESTKQQDGVLEFITENPIPSLIKFYDAKFLEKIIAGTAEEKDEDLDEEEDGDEETTSKKKKPGKKKPARDESDDDEEEEAPFDEDEEESDPDDDNEDDGEEEDDDEKEDDDEEEEVSSKKKKPSSVKRKPARKQEEDEEEESDDEEEEETEDDDEEESDDDAEEDGEESDEDEDGDDDEGEEDEEDESEEEEDPAPRKRVKPAAKKTVVKKKTGRR